jgi:hypothetical protein
VYLVKRPIQAIQPPFKIAGLWGNVLFVHFCANLVKRILHTFSSRNGAVNRGTGWFAAWPNRAYHVLLTCTNPPTPGPLGLRGDVPNFLLYNRPAYLQIWPMIFHMFHAFDCYRKIYVASVRQFYVKKTIPKFLQIISVRHLMESRQIGYRIFWRKNAIWFQLILILQRKQ